VQISGRTLGHDLPWGIGEQCFLNCICQRRENARAV
jgi:hypothetical protein